jgi:hypothetical protein
MAGNKNSGRKKTPDKDRFASTVAARFQPAEKVIVEHAAEIERKKAGRWLADVGLAAARVIVDEHAKRRKAS